MTIGAQPAMGPVLGITMGVAMSVVIDNVSAGLGTGIFLGAAFHTSQRSGKPDRPGTGHDNSDGASLD
jgi:hypothetical protein